MASVGLKLAVLLVTAAAVRVQGDCSTYRKVSEQARTCRAGYVAGIRDHMDNLLEFALTETCSSRNEYYDCMDEYTRNCSNREVIMAVVEGQLIMCNGTEVLRWVTDYILPEFDGNMACARTTDVRPCLSLAQGMSKISNDDPPETVLSTYQSIMTTIMPCMKKAFEDRISQNGCGETTWEDIYAVGIVAMATVPVFGMQAISETDMNGLLDYVINKINSDAV